MAPPTEGQHWSKTIFGAEPWNYYGPFAATFLEHAFVRVTERKHPNSIEYDPIQPKPRETDYAVITVNYDLVLESIAQDLNLRFGTKTTFYRTFKSPPDEVGFHGCLAKLHGSIDTADIVPPTWNKRLTEGSILQAWQAAHWLLANTNHLRVIGYSLPEGDNYVKYLLRAAIVHNPHLKSIDVLCLDPDGSVKRRYDQFISFPRYRFASVPVERYLQSYLNHYQSWPETVQFDALEKVHGGFFV